MSSPLLIDSPDQAVLQSEHVQIAPPIDYRTWFTGLFLQLSHRLGALALLATLGTWACLYLSKDCTIALAIACGTAEAGLLFALLVRKMTGSHPATGREANGVAIFNLVLFILALYLMAFTRLDEIRATAGQFFSPSAPPQVEQQW